MENLKQTLIQKFNLGTLSEAEALQLETFFQNGELDLEQLESYEIFAAEINEDAPSSQMDENFHKMLAEEMEAAKPKAKPTFGWFANLPLGIKWALPALLLCCGFLLGKNYQMSNQRAYAITQPADNSERANELLVKDLNDPLSTHNRINAVNQITESEAQEEQIIRLLFLSLNYDKSTNVRIAAIESLLKYADKALVRKGLIDAIRSQDSPMVLQFLSEALTIIGEKITLEQFRKLYNDDLPVEVIEQIEPNLKTFKI